MARKALVLWHQIFHFLLLLTCMNLHGHIDVEMHEDATCTSLREPFLIANDS